MTDLESIKLMFDRVGVHYQEDKEYTELLSSDFDTQLIVTEPGTESRCYYSFTDGTLMEHEIVGGKDKRECPF